MRGLSVVAAAMLLACSNGPKEPPATPKAPETKPDEAPVLPTPPALPPPPSGWMITLTVISAEVAGRMPNGEDWDSKSAPKSSTVPRPLQQYISQHPELFQTSAFLGVPVDAPKLEEESAKTLAADPSVILEVGDKVFRTPVRPRQFNPVWDFPVTFLVGKQGDRQGVPKDGNVRIRVVDYDGPAAYDVLGSAMLSLSELSKKKLHTLGPFGSVKKLVLKIDERPLPEAENPKPFELRLAVPGKSVWTASGIELIAGQRVTIEAADEVCSKGSSLSHCSGPEGQRKTSKYNLKGFEKIGHGALIAAVGDARFAVRRQLTFVAPSSGVLLLGINDKDTRDNRGSYAVRVEVASVP